MKPQPICLVATLRPNLGEAAGHLPSAKAGFFRTMLIGNSVAHSECSKQIRLHLSLKEETLILVFTKRAFIGFTLSILLLYVQIHPSMPVTHIQILDS